ncbi:hypothetical protein [Microvirga alba]|uniref:Uncharacterized protein n=1 Tax=Microvirga alba TaxID=2791025 RepID=A0A931BQB0_9HYPH|nr:hypothetical protein [Microvirga alba]MBF9231760.1 hypothetical protein [Microvirga alba]
MTHIRSHLAAAFTVAGIFVAAPALAQSSNCQDAQKFLTERQSLIQQINKLGDGGKKKQVDPRDACGIFTKLAANGDVGMKWITANKDWCQVPDQFADNFKQDHARAVEMKGKACQAAAKIAEMEKQAKKQAQQGGAPGLLGGGGLTGSYSMPKGAL